jgi:hypothetical protein
MSTMRAWPLLLIFVTPALAQTRTPVPEPTGSVAGHVFCADTNQPARFAHVSLEAISNASASAAPADSKPGPGAIALSAAPTTVETTLDGSFILTGVKPGAYYVIVEKTGYIKPRDIFTKKQMEDPSPDMRALIAAALPHVLVEASHTEQVEVRLEHGAAISGTILYDDGSPASDLAINLLRKDATGKWISLDGSMLDGTDDRGSFRLASLLSGEYLVEADLRFSGTKRVSGVTDAAGHSMDFAMMDVLFTLPFYGNGTPRKSQAASIKLAPGQELTGQDMQIPLTKLHKLTGRVAAGSDGHLVNAASVALVTREGNEEIATAEISRDDGLFHFDFVPEGDYLLRVTGARDVTWETPAPTPNAGNFIVFPTQDKEHVIATYGNVDLPLLLNGDMLDVIATVPPSAAATPAATAPQK